MAMSTRLQGKISGPGRFYMCGQVEEKETDTLRQRGCLRKGEM